MLSGTSICKKKIEKEDKYVMQFIEQQMQPQILGKFKAS